MYILTRNTARKIRENLARTDGTPHVRRWPRPVDQQQYGMVQILGSEETAEDGKQQLIHRFAGSINNVSKWSYEYALSQGDDFDFEKRALHCIVIVPYHTSRAPSPLGPYRECHDNHAEMLETARNMKLRVEPCFVDYMIGFAHIGDFVGAWFSGGLIFLAHGMMNTVGVDVTTDNTLGIRKLETNCGAETEYIACQNVKKEDKVYCVWIARRPGLESIEICCSSD